MYNVDGNENWYNDTNSLKNAGAVDIWENVSDSWPNITPNRSLKELDIPYTISELFVAITAVVGNAVVMVVFLKEKKLRRKTRYYILSLAAADFLVGLFGVPFVILASVGLPRHPHFCLFTLSSLIGLCTISIYSLVAVSADRYWAIIYPISYSQIVRTGTTKRIVASCWVLGGLVGFSPLMGWHNVYREEECSFLRVLEMIGMDWKFQVFFSFPTIVLPTILLSYFYTHIYTFLIIKRARDRTSARNSGMTLRALRNSRARAKRAKGIKSLLVIVIFFMICFLPLFTMKVIYAIYPELQHRPISKSIYKYFMVLGHFNSSCNPYIYAYNLKDFRKAVWKLLCCQKDQRYALHRRIASIERQISESF